MAFTDAQRALIRRFLGYPDVYRDHDPRLESAMDVVGGRVEVEALIVADLTALAAVDVAITGAISSGGLKRIDDIEFFEGAQMLSMRDHGRSIIGRISAALGVPIWADYYGKSGYLGDGWMAAQGTVFPLG